MYSAMSASVGYGLSMAATAHTAAARNSGRCASRTDMAAVAACASTRCININDRHIAVQHLKLGSVHECCVSAGGCWQAMYCAAATLEGLWPLQPSTHQSEGGEEGSSRRPPRRERLRAMENSLSHACQGRVALLNRVLRKRSGGRSHSCNNVSPVSVRLPWSLHLQEVRSEQCDFIQLCSGSGCDATHTSTSRYHCRPMFGEMSSTWADASALALVWSMVQSQVSGPRGRVPGSTYPSTTMHADYR